MDDDRFGSWPRSGFGGGEERPPGTSVARSSLDVNLVRLVVLVDRDVDPLPLLVEAVAGRVVPPSPRLNHAPGRPARAEERHEHPLGERVDGPVGTVRADAPDV